MLVLVGGCRVRLGCDWRKKARRARSRREDGEADAKAKRERVASSAPSGVSVRSPSGRSDPSLIMK